MNKAKPVIIFTELGDGIGYGHFSRCSAIHQRLKRKNFDAILVANVRGEYQLDNEIIICDWVKNWRKIITNLSPYILVDSYLVSKEILIQIQQKSSKLILLDDYYRIVESVNLIINPNIYYKSFRYQCASLGGRDFIILRHAFREENCKALIKEKVNSVLITLGGSDYRNLLPEIVQSILTHFPQFNLFVVTGREAHRQKFKDRFPNNSRLNFYGFLNEDRMKDLMLNCDLAISACGQTLHELAYLGIPTIGVSIDKDQELNLMQYVELGFLDQPRYWDQGGLLASINESINDYKNIVEKRARVSKIGYQNIKANGVDKIIEAIFK